jgi:superfamily II DNA or RNA helicase
MRFGDDRSNEVPLALDGSTPGTRKERVRAAFNSPFWPFVVVSTSVGQEGLDFHHYCHAITHWNLPSNPVDLEQREGRIHRYTGHAVRAKCLHQLLVGLFREIPLVSHTAPY